MGCGTDEVPRELKLTPRLTALLLAGGFGTRIRELYPDVPKPMIPVAGKPFLEWAIRYWARQGVRRFLLSLGHLAPVAQAYFAERAEDGLEILCFEEPQPMGTGGAVLYAAAQAAISDPLIVANGDSLVVADTGGAQRLLSGNPALDGALLGVEVADASRYGTLAIGNEGRLLGFKEKQPGSGVINAGVYFFRPSVLGKFPERMPLSMEVDVFPALLGGGADLRVCGVEAPFLDIGTPETVALAEAFIVGNSGAF